MPLKKETQEALERKIEELRQKLRALPIVSLCQEDPIENEYCRYRTGFGIVIQNPIGEKLVIQRQTFDKILLPYAGNKAKNEILLQQEYGDDFTLALSEDEFFATGELAHFLKDYDPQKKI